MAGPLLAWLHDRLGHPEDGPGRSQPYNAAGFKVADVAFVTVLPQGQASPSPEDGVHKQPLPSD